MSWVAIGVAVAGTAVSYGLSQSSQPNQPNLAASSAGLSAANAQMLPIRRMLEAAAQQGTKVTIPGQFDYQYKKHDGTWASISEWQYDQLAQTHRPVRRNPKTVDFTGLGSAQVQAKIAEQMADVQKNLSAKYDSQFIDSALSQEKLADPQSFAAREKMSDLIQQQVNDKPERPVADLLDRQIGDQLTAAQGGHLDDQMRGVLDNSVQSALSDRGGNGGANGADFEQPLVTGAAGEQRKRDAAQKAISWLTSGATPEDVNYRREQQNLSNLSSEVNGRTPQSQFASLSGAQNGPTPFHGGQPLSTMPTGQNGAAQGAAIGSWNTQMGYANSQASPFAAAVSGTANLAQLLGSAGWKPLASTGTS